jgi:hypothetical protein
VRATARAAVIVMDSGASANAILRQAVLVNQLLLRKHQRRVMRDDHRIFSFTGIVSTRQFMVM